MCLWGEGGGGGAAPLICHDGGKRITVTVYWIAVSIILNS